MNRLLLMLLVGTIACQPDTGYRTFKEDRSFLDQHTDIIVLTQGASSVIVSPTLQGRVLTSSSNGPSGKSYGWFNRKLIQHGLASKNNVLGGEDRIWFGPEYGKYSIFFKPGEKMTGENIQVPDPLDNEAFELIDQNTSSVLLKKQMTLVNYQNYQFNIELKRHIKLLHKSEIQSILDIELGKDINAVGFISSNTMTNKNDSAWSMDSGLLSIWILGAFHPHDQLTVVLPLQKPTRNIVNYWTEVDEKRLKIEEDKAYYKGDAN